MTADLASILRKAIAFAEQATTEDRAGNHEVAAKAYLAATEWLIHATKYESLNDTLKKTVRGKAAAYLKRAEQLKKIMNIQPPPAPATTPIPNDDPDVAQMIQQFQGTIINRSDVTFADVVGLEQAKITLKEVVILPMKYPRLLEGKRKPWTGILLYGPPGTGKSVLAKAVAAESNAAFIAVHAADLLSRWVGESLKRVKNLFGIAHERRPCVVFIDGLEFLCTPASDSEYDASQRVRTEFLGQMHEICNTDVVVFAATNLPWALNRVIQQTFEKCIYIPLPELNERTQMFKKHLDGDIPHTIKAEEWVQLGQRSEHYSGADIGVVCREALLRRSQRPISATHFKEIPNENKGEGEPSHLWLVCSPADANAGEMSLNKIHPDEVCESPVTLNDVLAALKTQRPVVSEADFARYTEFTTHFGQHGV